jgi:CheY-like chemotaxis protein
MDTLLESSHGRSHAEGPRPLRVLVVDDNPLIRRLASAQMKCFEIEPTLACDGLQAVQLFEERGFDIVLMDLIMPTMSGVAATKRIRQFERSLAPRPRVPILAYTNLDEDRARAEMEGAGFDGLLSKPCDSSALGACFKRYCAEKFAAL